MTRRIWIAAFALFALVALGLWAAAVWLDRGRVLEEAEGEANVLTLLLEEHADRALESADGLVRSVASQAQAWDGREAEVGRRVHEQMVAAAEASPQVHSAWMLDAAGNAVLDSWEYPPPNPGNYAYRDYYQAARAAVEAGEGDAIFVGAPDTGTTTGQKRFTLSRAVVGPKGDFRGVVVAGIRTGYFRGFYEEVRAAEGATVMLLHDDGTVLASWPVRAAGGDAPGLAALAKAAGPALPTVASDGTGIRAVRRLRDLPVAVATSLPQEATLAGWRERAMVSAVVPGAAILGFGLLMALGLRGTRDLEDAKATLEKRVGQRTADLSASERELKLVADAVPALIAFVDCAERYRFVNAAYAEWMGMRREELVGQPLSAAMRPAALEASRPAIAAVLAGERVRREIEGENCANERHHLEAQYIPRREADGSVTGFYFFAADVTERKAAEKRQGLLMAELDHRVRNILATIQSTIALTDRATDDKAGFARAIAGRVAAMARTQDRLTRENWRGARLERILRDELGAYAPGESHFALDVPEGLVLPPRDALNLALVVHELSTNAAKYGALSTSDGCVRVSGAVHPGEGPDGKAMLRLSWRECGGPSPTTAGESGRPNDAPGDRPCGFGSHLIANALGPQAEVTLRYPESGCACDIALPVDAPLGLLPAGEARAAQIPDGRAPPAANDVRSDRLQTGGRPAQRILVVEDEALLAMELERVLDELGAETVGPAHSLSQARALLEAERMDGAVIDLNLQGLSSEPLADALLERGVPFVFLSGYSADASLPERLRHVPYLQKPASAAALQAHLLARLGRDRDLAADPPDEEPA